MVEMPEPKGVNLPKARNQTDVTLEDEDEHRVIMLTLDAVRGRSDYIDNWIGTADIEVELISIAPTAMTLKFTQGQSVTFSVADIVTGPAVPALIYRRKNGVIFPVDSRRVVKLDGENTPHIVRALYDAEQEAQKRRQLREDIARIVYAFSKAIEVLAHAATIGKQFSEASGESGEGRGRGKERGSKGSRRRMPGPVKSQMRLPREIETKRSLPQIDQIHKQRRSLAP